MGWGSEGGWGAWGGVGWGWGSVEMGNRWEKLKKSFRKCFIFSSFDKEDNFLQLKENKFMKKYF